VKFWCYFLLMGTESHSDKSLVLAWSPATSVFIFYSFEGLAEECEACNASVFSDDSCLVCILLVSFVSDKFCGRKVVFPSSGYAETL